MPIGPETGTQHRRTSAEGGTNQYSPQNETSLDAINYDRPTGRDSAEKLADALGNRYQTTDIGGRFADSY